VAPAARRVIHAPTRPDKGWRCSPPARWRLHSPASKSAGRRSRSLRRRSVEARRAHLARAAPWSSGPGLLSDSGSVTRLSCSSTRAMAAASSPIRPNRHPST